MSGKGGKRKSRQAVIPAAPKVAPRSASHSALFNSAAKMTPAGFTSLAVAGLLVTTQPGDAFAIDKNATPQGGNVVAGSADISYGRNKTTINQHSNRTVIDWNSGQAEVERSGFRA